jgi:hypothetical protein
MTDEVIVKVVSISEKALGKALEYIERTESFVTEQAPLLVQEILAWGFAENLIYAGIWTVLCLGLSYGLYRLIKVLCHEGGDEEDFVIPVVIIGGGTNILLWVVAFSYILEVVKISVAPRLYLLEVFKSLL